MTDIEERLYNQLLEKSQEAFVMAIELYNKPTLKYRVEGFAFFVCNAWELMLKAKIVKDAGETAIYYKESDTRTISLENCIKVVFTNERDPLRKNLEKIIELRNTSTHFITQEYEFLYVPLFQACSYNFADKLLEFHTIDISQQIPVHFINLAVAASPLLDKDYQSRYSQSIYNKLVKTQSIINELTQSTSSDRFSIVIQQELRLTKKHDGSIPAFRLTKATEVMDGNCTIIKEIQDPNNTHPYNVKRLMELIDKRLKREGLNMSFTRGNFTEFNNYFDFKGNPEFCFTNTINTNPTYSYSPKTVDFILAAIMENPEICNEIRNKKRNQKKQLTPGARDSQLP